MNMPRFCCAIALKAAVSVDLPEAQARHATKVLRLRLGDDLTLFNGSGGEYVCRIACIEPRRVSVDVLEWQPVERESALFITLVQALQAGEKMDMTVQKAVELGVARIVPVTTKRSVVRLAGDRAERRLVHWRGVVASACEQCGRNRLPEVAALENLDAWLAKPAPAGVLRLMLAPDARRALVRCAPPAPGAGVELLIGAEGGLSPDEAERATAAGYEPVRLGPRVLRTETAGLAALAAIQCLWGDFRGVDDDV